jgi:transposase-like protein
MSEIRAQYDEEFKKNAVKLSYASPKSVKQVADDLGIKENLLYRWITVLGTTAVFSKVMTTAWWKTKSS